MGVVVEDETGFGHGDQCVVGRAGNAEDDIAAVLVEIHHADLEQQRITGMGFGFVGRGKVGHDDPGAILTGLGYPVGEQEARPRLGNHRDHRIVGQMVAGVDVGDSYSELGGKAVLVFREMQGKTRHGSLGSRSKVRILALCHSPRLDAGSWERS